VAPSDATDAIRKVHDFLTVGAPAPLQEAVAVGLETLGDDYTRRLAHEYRARRDLYAGAGRRRLPVYASPAAYYVLRCSRLRAPGRRSSAFWLTKRSRDPVPGSSLFSRPELGGGCAVRVL